MPVSNSFWGIREDFSGSGSIDGVRINDSGFVARYSNALWNTFPENGLGLTAGYLSRAAGVASAELSVDEQSLNLEGPGLTLSSIPFPSALSLELSMGFSNTNDGQAVGSVLSWIHYDGSVADLQQNPEAVGVTTAYVFCANLDNDDTGLTTFPDLAQYINSLGALSIGATSIFLLRGNFDSLTTGDYLNAISYACFYPFQERLVLRLENNTSRLNLRISVRPGLVYRSDALLGQPGFDGFLDPQRYYGPFPPSDLTLASAGYSRTYAVNAPLLTLQGSLMNISYPRVYDLEYRFGSAGGWKVGMI